MVSNIERIFAEIEQGAEQFQEECRLEPETIVRLIMEIVELEDQNRIKAVGGINKKIKGMISNATPIYDQKEDS